MVNHPLHRLFVPLFYSFTYHSLIWLNNSLGGFTPIIDSTGKITGYKTKVGADTVFPFSSQKDFVVIFRYAGIAHNVLLYNATTKKFHYGLGQTFSSDYFSVDSNGSKVTVLKKG